MKRIIERRRERRIKKQIRRRRFVTVMLGLCMIMILPQMVGMAFAKKAESEVITVSVRHGDSVWSIAKRYAPENSDIRGLVYDIIDKNNIENGRIYSGQELIIPLG